MMGWRARRRTQRQRLEEAEEAVRRVAEDAAKVEANWARVRESRRRADVSYARLDRALTENHFSDHIRRAMGGP